jgi:septal ring factor EnvC (AmiA/AmiB activator)
MESVWAAIAVVVTTAGGLYTTSYHWGQVNQQIEEVKTRAEALNAHVAKHDDQLDDIKQQNARMQQALDDIKDTLHDIRHDLSPEKSHDHHG